MEKMLQRLSEIESRKAEIRSLIENGEEADLKELNQEVDSLNAEAEEVRAKVESEKEVRQSILKGVEPVKEIENPMKEERGVNMTREEMISSKEYRAYWLANLQGKKELSQEQRAGEVIASQVSGAIPTETYGQFISKIRETAPLLNEITMLNVAGNVNFAVEGVMNGAAIHTENADVTPAADTLITVSLGGFEIIKLVRISATIRNMAIDAFEGWLVGQLAEQVAIVIENWIINGTGNSQPKGVDYAAAWTDGTNAVDYTTNITYAELVELVSYLKGGYARRAKFLVNHKTFWQQIQAIRNDASYPVVTQDPNGQYRCMGIPVVMSDYVADGDIFLGDLSKVVGNLSQDIEVSSDASAGFTANATYYRGTAIFDCDIAVGEAFVKAANTL